VPWLEPIPTTSVAGSAADPASIIAMRDSTRLALVVAYQLLSARQRAALLLVDVLGYRPAEVAGVLGISVTAVRSLLQRARTTLSMEAPPPEQRATDTGVADDVLRRYLAAFEGGDTAAIATLLSEDIEFEMPPIPTWFRGRDDVVDHFARRAFSRPRRAIATSANCSPALATYVSAGDGSFSAHGIHVLEITGGRIRRVVVFLDADLLPRFGLPLVLDGAM
jgi:RNA polymerase sigma-70 factor (ECF subfamily)